MAKLQAEREEKLAEQKAKKEQLRMEREEKAEMKRLKKETSEKPSLKELIKMPKFSDKNHGRARKLKTISLAIFQYLLQVLDTDAEQVTQLVH